MTQAINAPGFSVLRGVQLTKEVAYLNMREAAAAAALNKLWSDTFLTNAGIDAGESANYLYRGSANYDVIKSTAAYATAGDFDPTSRASFDFTGSGDIECQVNDNSMFSLKEFTGDFTLDVIFGTNTGDHANFGVYLKSEQATFNASLNEGGLAAMTGSWHIWGNGNIKTGNTVNATFTPDTTSVMRIERVGSTLKLYKGGALVHTWALTSSATLVMQFGGINAGVIGHKSVQWTDSTTGSDCIIQSVRALDLAADVTSVIPFVDVTLNTGSLDLVEVSTDDGATWTTVTADQINSVPAGAQLKLRVTISGNAELESWGIAA